MPLSSKIEMGEENGLAQKGQRSDFKEDVQ